MTLPAAGARVLVVEDDQNLRLTLVDNLEEEGYAVEAASTLAAARARGKADPFDVVVLDLMLPDGDGYTLCRALRQAGSPSRVLLLTARTLEVKRGELIEWGDAKSPVPHNPVATRRLLSLVSRSS